MKENRIVPDTLADLLITFTLSGYYDSSLRQAIDAAPRRTTAMTTWFSAHQTFPDAFFQFNRSGRMDWQVSPDFLSLQDSLGALRNVAVLLLPAAKRPELGRLICSYAVDFEVDQQRWNPIAHQVAERAIQYESTDPQCPDRHAIAGKHHLGFWRWDQHRRFGRLSSYLYQSRPVRSDDADRFGSASRRVPRRGGCIPSA